MYPNYKSRGDAQTARAGLSTAWAAAMPAWAHCNTTSLLPRKIPARPAEGALWGSGCAVDSVH